jgi:hypothetical protein
MRDLKGSVVAQMGTQSGAEILTWGRVMKSVALRSSRSTPASYDLPVVLIFALVGLVVTFLLIGSGYPGTSIDLVGP